MSCRPPRTTRALAIAAAWSVLLALSPYTGSAAAEAVEWRFEGMTMGSAYHITVAAPPAGVSKAALGQAVDAALARVDARMSTWKADSEVSRFNRAAPGAWFAVSAETAQVVSAAQATAQDSGGVFDITVGPLVDLWGFGAGATARETIPAEAAIDAARARTGWQALEVRLQPPALRKRAPREIDLSAIAKGYGVDAAAHALEAAGVRDYLVEVGGEVRAGGRNAAREPWRIGIADPAGGGVALAVPLTDAAIATSGDYFNYFEQDGKRYSHTIDPRSGRPVTHALASVSVVAPDCMSADALATAIDVLGPEEGLAFAERRQLAVYLLVRTATGFEARASTTFAPLLRAATAPAATTPP